MIRVPLLTRDGEHVATALLDDADRHLLDGGPWRFHQGTGYARRGDVYMHRAVHGLTPGDGMVIDHVNGDQLDNRRENLRVCEHRENQQNRHTARGSSSHRGVYWNSTERRWIAKVMVDGRSYTIGRYGTENAAAEAASAFRAERMPFSADARAAA